MQSFAMEITYSFFSILSFSYVTDYLHIKLCTELMNAFDFIILENVKSEQ